MVGYNIYKIFLAFISYAFLGWCLEVVFHIFTERRFINRGFLSGPLCPIYGVGAVLIIMFLDQIDSSFWSIFLGGMIFASLLEIVTGYVLFKVFKTRWWDYSESKFNIGGYISLEFSLAWGFASIFMMRVLQPRVNGFIMSIPAKYVNKIAIILFLIFVLDVITTLKSLISFRSVLKEVNLIREDWMEQLLSIKSEKEMAFREKNGSRMIELEEKYKKYENIYNEKMDKFNKQLGLKHKAFFTKYPNLKKEELIKRIKNIRK